MTMQGGPAGPEEWEGRSLPDLVAIARARLDRDSARRDAEIAAREIAISLMDSVVRDPTLGELQETILGHIAQGRTGGEALLAMRPASDASLDARLGRIEESLSRFAPAGLLGSAADIDSLVPSRSAALAGRMSDVERLLRELHERFMGTPDAEQAAAPPVGGEAPSPKARRSDAGIPRPDQGRRATGPRRDTASNRVRVVSEQYISERRKPVTVQEVREYLELNGHLEGVGYPKVVEDVFSRTFIRFGDNAWLTADHALPRSLPSLRALIPSHKGKAEKALKLIADWNGERPEGSPELVAVPRGERRAK